MAEEPTKNELKQKIRDLKEQLAEKKKDIDIIRTSEKKYRALARAANFWINEVDLNGTFTYVNNKVKDVLGYLPEELIGRSIFDFQPEDEKKVTKEFFKEIIGEKKSFSGYISTHIHKNGKVIILETNGTPIFNAKGDVTGYWCLGRDITKKIEAEQQLRESEAKWRSLVESAPNMIMIVDREGTIKFINKTLPGYSIKDTIGTNHLDYTEQKYHEIIKDVLEQVFRTGEPSRYTFQGIGPNNSIAWYETHVGPLKNDNNVDAVTLITTDVTKHKKAEEILRKAHEETENQVRERTAELLQTNTTLQVEISERKKVEESLQESEQRFRSLVEAMGDMVWEIDLEGKYTYISPKSEDLLGRTPNEIIGKTPFSFMPANEAKRSYEYLKSVYSKLIPILEFESVVFKKDGRRINVAMNGMPILDPDGNLIGYRGVDKDITERVRSQEHMFQAAKMVSLGTLVSGVAHEINNPITSIMLNGPILQKIWTDTSPVLDEYCIKHGDINIGSSTYTQLRGRVPILLSNIAEGTKRVKRIVEELKNFAQQRPSDLSEDVDINNTVKSTVGLVSNLIRKATNNFDVEYGTGIPMFRGNTQRIEQVTINLIINACEALPDTNHSIRLTTAYDKISGKVVIKIMDQGEGMLPEVLERIGDPFFTTKRDTGGTGLGLAISRKIIEDHKGTIEFDSSPDGGTTATVKIPIKNNL